MSLIREPGEITGAWLSTVLGGEPELLGTERIGTGQMSQSHRVRFGGADGESSVIVKLASDDATSRATGVGMGAYYREIAFYANLAERIGGPLAHCHLAVYDEREGWFTLVLEDMRDALVGDQIAGCELDQARAAIRTLARLHGPVIGDLALGTADYLNQPNPLDQALLSQLIGPFLERYGERIASEHAELCERLVQSLDAWAADRRPPLGLVHGDFRLDNLLFAGDSCTAVDWQTVTWGPALVDVSYFIGGCLRVEDRRAHERELIGLYRQTLLEQGYEGLGFEQCWEEYRRACFQGLVMTIAASMVVVRTDRGDDMFMTWLARNAQQAIDLDAVALLPAPNTTRLPALRPDPADEGRHPPGPEALWNESWYFDAVSDAGDLGLYVRLGRLPNEGVCLYTACVCGPGRPSIMLVDAAAPLPDAADERQAIATAGLAAAQECLEPLQRFRVTAAGTAEAHADHSAPLRGERGEPLEVEPRRRHPHARRRRAADAGLRRRLPAARRRADGDRGGDGERGERRERADRAGADPQRPRRARPGDRTGRLRRAATAGTGRSSVAVSPRDVPRAGGRRAHRQRLGRVESRPAPLSAARRRGGPTHR